MKFDELLWDSEKIKNFVFLLHLINVLIFIKWSIHESDLLADQHNTLFYFFWGVCVKFSSFIHRMLNREV